MQKNSFIIKNCVKTDLKQKRGYILSQFYYKVGKNKGSIFFKSVCGAAILHIAFLYSWADRKKWLPVPHFLAVEMKKWCVRKMHVINDGVEASTRKSQTRFQIIHLMLGRASHETK